MSEDHGEYCRRVEAYLCRRNDGHLIRIVGPAFEMVRGWAERGVPLAIVCQGIDRSVERHAAKGTTRRRPVQIQFCEADVLDLFDDWRRAIGVRDTDAPPGEDGEPGDEPQRRGSLPSHLERVIARLTMMRGTGAADDEAIDRVVRELDGARGSARHLRGAAREAFLDRLRAIDEELLDIARCRLAGEELTAMRVEAAEELAPFKDRLPVDAYERASLACVERLLRARARLPRVAFD